jgi:hypothetical protein
MRGNSGSVINRIRLVALSTVAVGMLYGPDAATDR